MKINKIVQLICIYGSINEFAPTSLAHHKIKASECPGKSQFDGKGEIRDKISHVAVPLN
jgi:hypothetical protein